MKTVKRCDIGIRAVVRLLKRKRALVGLGVLASLLVMLSLISSTATCQGGKEQLEAGGEAPAEAPDEVPNPGMGSMAVKVIGSVVLLIGVLYAGMYALRILSGRGGKGGLDSGAISVLHRTHIAPKKAIYVLKVGQKAMVLGVTDSQISHLSDLSEEELASIKIHPKSKSRSFRQHFLGFALGVKEKP